MSYRKWFQVNIECMLLPGYNLNRNEADKTLCNNLIMTM